MTITVRTDAHAALAVINDCVDFSLPTGSIWGNKAYTLHCHSAVVGSEGLQREPLDPPTKFTSVSMLQNC